MNRRAFFHALAIIVLGLIAYANSFSATFQGDETKYLLENPFVNGRGTLDDVRQQDPGLSASLAQRILGYLTFKANFALHGPAPFGYHAVNLAIHLANGVLVYLLVLLTFRTPLLCRPGPDEQAPLVAIGTALLFVSHPVQTEAVTYIMQRLTSLAALFYLLSLLCYVCWRLTGESVPHAAGTASAAPGARLQRRLRYAGALVAALAAMKTKENAVTLPVIILLYELVFFRGRLRERLVRLAPLLATVLVVPLTTLLVLSRTSMNIGQLTLSEDVVSRHDYLVTQVRVVATYLRLLILPAGQNFIHDYPVFRSFFAVPVIASALVHAALLGAAAMLFRRSRSGDPRQRFAAFGILWFYITLSVESSIIPLPRLLYEYRLYLPSVGFLAAAVTALFTVTAGRVRAAAVMAAVLLASLLLAGATYRRNAVWGDNVLLYEDAVRKSPGSALAHASLGGAYASAGRLEDAIREYRITVRLHPQYTAIWYNLALSCAQTGKASEAATIYREVLLSDPLSALTYYNPAVVDGAQRAAIEGYFRSAPPEPGMAGRFYRTGIVAAQEGNAARALQLFTMTVILQPSHRDAHLGLAELHAREGRDQEAVREYRDVLRLDPEHLGARIDLGGIYVRMGAYEQARSELRKALAQAPASEDIRYNLQIVEDLIRREEQKKRP